MYWLTAATTIQRFQVAEGCFLKATARDQNRFAWIPIAKADEVGLMLLDEVAAELKVKPQGLQVKLLVPSFLRSRFENRSFGRYHVEVQYRDDLDSDFVYDPASRSAGIEKKPSRIQVSQPEMAVRNKIRVLIVEDSRTVRGLLTKILSQDTHIEVIAGLESAEEAEKFLAANEVDVLTLDINLPGMDGADLLKRIYPVYKIPTVLITSLTLGQSSKVFEALEAGAIDYIQKPEFSHLAEQGRMIIEKVKVAHDANITEAAKTKCAGRSKELRFDTDGLIVVGSSTGGTNAVAEILERLPADIPPILIVQHIPPLFSKSFADRLNQTMPFHVKEAEDGDRVEKNSVLVAPGGLQMRLDKVGRGQYKVSIVDDPPVNRFKPSVDYFFRSAAKVYEGQLIATILTGMGRDGAQGLLELKNKGFSTIAQDKDSSVVYGMPRVAAEIGAAQYIVALNDIAKKWSDLSTKSIKQKGA